MNQLTKDQIADIINCLTKMERSKMVYIKRGVHYSGFDDMDRLVDMGLLDKTGMLSADGRRVWDAFPHHWRY